MDERMYETGHGGGEVRRGADCSFEPNALKELACPLGGLQLGMLMIYEYGVYKWTGSTYIALRRMRKGFPSRCPCSQ